MNIWKGVIENNIDEKKLGKVQVRIFGKHTENKSIESQDSYLSVDNLPWAKPAFSIGSPNISGQCNFAIPEKGSIVYGFFEDEDEQDLVYFATALKIVSENPDFSKGFSDPDKINPKSDMIGESQISRLARNEKINQTIIQEKKNSVVSCDKFSEPVTEYAAKYPDNKVIETKSGHVIELDDTEGKERIHIYHKSGTSIELFPDGRKVENVKNDSFNIIHGNHNIYIDGDKNIEITGNVDKKITGSVNTEITGNEEKKITGISKESSSEKEIKAPKIKIEGANVKITGGILTVNGEVTIGNGPFCFLKKCLFANVPHQGNIVTNT